MPPNVSIRNLGPIAEADVESKPLTIFVGPNNSGKSYVALTIYSLNRSLGDSDPHFGRLGRRRFRRFRGLRERSAEEWNVVGDFLKNNRDGLEGLFATTTNLKAIPDELHDLVRQESTAWSGQLAHSVDYELRRCFGVTLDDLGRRNRKTERGEFEIYLNDDSTGFRWDIRCHNDELVTTNWDPDVSQGRLRLDPARLPIDLLDEPEFFLDEPEFFLQVLMGEYSAHLMNGYSATTHYLPASRSGILLGHKTLASLIVRSASRAWIEPMDVPRLPGVITDLIEALLLLGQEDARQPRFPQIVEFLESSVTQGRIDIDSQLEYPEITYDNEGGTFKLHQVSSMVSEIAPLLLFLKFLIGPGHLFIVEEPESHLDPANQRHLAKAIARIVNAGVKVLVTTHSDIFLNQINNLMRISAIRSDQLRERGYEEEDILAPERVGAYLFHPNIESGTRVEPMTVDPEYGISTESFDRVHRALYDEVIELEHTG